MSNKNIIWILALLLLASFAAASDYGVIGSYHGEYYTDKTRFNNIRGTDYASNSVTITSGSYIPLATDLDNDNTTEILVIDGNVIKVYHDNDLNSITDIAIGNATGYKTMITYDITGDGKKEIIVAGSTGGIMIINYTNGAHNNITTIKPYNHTTGEISLGCKGTNDCVAAYAQKIDVMRFGYMEILPFTSTGPGTAYKVTDGLENAYNLKCMPFDRHVYAANVDGAGDVEFVMSYAAYESTAGNTNEVILLYFDSNGNTVTNMNVINHALAYNSGVGDTFNDAGSNEACNTDASNYLPQHAFTSPLVMDVDGGGGNMDMIIGVMQGATSFKMHRYDVNGDKKRSYPTIFVPYGQILSNPVRASVFSNTNDRMDFCIMGYIENYNNVDLLCGSEKNYIEPLIYSDEFFLNITEGGEPLPFNVSRDYDNLNAIIHTGYAYAGDNRTEFITPYGVMYTNEGPLHIGSELYLIWEVPDIVAQSSIIPVDPERTGWNDLLMLSPTNLWYFDDEFENTGSHITYKKINPCLQGTWKLNTTLSVVLTVADPDGDDVSAQVILYYNDIYEQKSGWKPTAKSGSTFSFTFPVNATIATSKLRLMTNDTGNQNDPEILDYDISVAINGLENGDCVTEETTPLEIEDGGAGGGVTTTTTNPTDPNEDDNVFKRVMDNSIINSFGLGYTVIWLIITMVIVGAVWIQGSHLNPGISFGMALISAGLMLIIGIYLGFISVGLIITLTVLSMIGIGIWIAKHITGSGGG